MTKPRLRHPEQRPRRRLTHGKMHCLILSKQERMPMVARFFIVAMEARRTHAHAPIPAGNHAYGSPRTNPAPPQKASPRREASERSPAGHLPPPTICHPVHLTCHSERSEGSFRRQAKPVVTATGVFWLPSWMFRASRGTILRSLHSLRMTG